VPESLLLARWGEIREESPRTWTASVYTVVLARHRHITRPRYNNLLPDSDAKTKAAQARVLRAETIGLLVVAMLVLGLILMRWGRFLDWHVR